MDDELENTPEIANDDDFDNDLFFSEYWNDVSISIEKWKKFCSFLNIHLDKLVLPQ